MCFTFHAVGKGYVRTKNKYQHDIPISAKEYQGETVQQREMCFWYDDLQPVHCKPLQTCSGLDLIQIANPITKSSSVEIGIDGWKDQDTFKNNTIKASGVRQYELSVYNIGGDSSELQVNTKADANNSRVSNVSKPLHIEFSSCGLYEVRLEVVDNAGEGNVRGARKFVIFDNCSDVQKDPLEKVVITTADDISSKVWQTQKRKICFEWSGRFFNTLHKSTNLLKPIERNSLISHDYDDNDYPLPRTGTHNVDGIVEFNFTVTVNGAKRILNQRHENVSAQTHCLNISLQDGDTVIVDVAAVDIMGNSDVDSTKVFIDTSVPEITNMGLTRQGIRGLFVHNTIELSRMKMVLNIHDVHSGVRSIQWYLGTKLGYLDIGNGTLAVNRLANGVNDIQRFQMKIYEMHCDRM